MKTTVEIPDALFRQAKSRAALQGIRLRDLIVRGLELALEQAAPAESFRQTFPIIAGSSEWVITNEAVKEAIEQVEQDEGQTIASFMRR